VNQRHEVTFSYLPERLGDAMIDWVLWGGVPMFDMHQFFAWGFIGIGQALLDVEAVISLAPDKNRVLAEKLHLYIQDRVKAMKDLCDS
jgi:hypothetical protein